MSTPTTTIYIIKFTNQVLSGTIPASVEPNNGTQGNGRGGDRASDGSGSGTVMTQKAQSVICKWISHSHILRVLYGGHVPGSGLPLLTQRLHCWGSFQCEKLLNGAVQNSGWRAMVWIQRWPWASDSNTLNFSFLHLLNLAHHSTYLLELPWGSKRILQGNTKQRAWHVVNTLWL